MVERNVYELSTIHFLSLSCVLLAAGCNYSGRSGNITAINLVTKSDAERVLGVPMRLWIDTTSGQESTCAYVEAPNGSQICLQATMPALDCLSGSAYLNCRDDAWELTL